MEGDTGVEAFVNCETGIRFRIYYAEEGDNFVTIELKMKDSNELNAKTLLHINRIDAYINYNWLKQEADEDIKLCST